MWVSYRCYGYLLHGILRDPVFDALRMRSLALQSKWISTSGDVLLCYFAVLTPRACQKSLKQTSHATHQTNFHHCDVYDAHHSLKTGPENQNRFAHKINLRQWEWHAVRRSCLSGSFTKAPRACQSSMQDCDEAHGRNQPLANKDAAINIFHRPRWADAVLDMPAHTSRLTTEWRFSYQLFSTHKHHRAWEVLVYWVTNLSIRGEIFPNSLNTYSVGALHLRQIEEAVK